MTNAAGTSSYARHEPYELLAILPQTVDLEARLSSTGFRTHAADDSIVVDGDGTWSCRVRRDPPNKPFTLRRQSFLNEAETHKIAGASEAVLFWTEIRGASLSEATDLIRFVGTTFPELLAVRDLGSFVYHSPRWVAAIVGGRPIRLTEIFDVHLVYNHEDLWAHTHGLARLGLIDLEVFADVDDPDPSLYGRLLMSAAATLAFGGLPRPTTPFRLATDITANWIPWESYERPTDALGGASDRDEAHSGPSGVLLPSDDDVEFVAGVSLDEEGWVDCEVAGAWGIEVARTIESAYDCSRSVVGRYMWIASAGWEAVVTDIANGEVTARDNEGNERRIGIGAVEHWGVATESGFSLGPWLAHELSQLEDLEQRWARDKGTDGPVCGECGQSLGGPSCCHIPDDAASS